MTVEFSKQHTSWKIILELAIGNVVICEVDDLLYVVLSEEEKRCLIWKLLVPQNAKRYSGGVAQTDGN